MGNIKHSKNFVIPIKDNNFSRYKIKAYMYLYCIEHGLKPTGYAEYSAIYLNEDGTPSHCLHAILLK